MTSPKIRSEISDTTVNRSAQHAAYEKSAAGFRIVEALGERTRTWLAKHSDLPDSTISDAIKRGPARTEVAVKIADTLGVSLDWLVRGTGIASASKPAVADASDADWVPIPTYDLSNLHDGRLGDPVRTTPIRRDWLNSTLGAASGLWLTSLPNDYPPIEMREGDKVFCQDIAVADLRDRHLCIWRDDGSSRLFVGRFSVVRPETIHIDADGEYWVGRINVAMDDPQPSIFPIGRILGRPIAQIR